MGTAACCTDNTNCSQIERESERDKERECVCVCTCVRASACTCVCQHDCACTDIARPQARNRITHAESSTGVCGSMCVCKVPACMCKCIGHACIELVRYLHSDDDIIDMPSSVVQAQVRRKNSRADSEASETLHVVYVHVFSHVFSADLYGFCSHLNVRHA
jgi:hypothetical protein